ncbi:methyltransferase domain-containing protein [Paenibacillus filicis]|uniref:Methyltransferase domain-containing protein n=1 Tax=Paenibacillus gyeongsangnamensis TaxID=3388067 RepID=A0ABT4QA14_9BACL|nr:methyltransferase domain-containing protein [Paenibacillus filicis]MCZ8513695.1 methyltransferase domain-containing protein [Paenibacillus filicis]
MSERRFDPVKMARLDSPERRKALPPEKILSLLEIKENDTVLDMGAGTGYFSFPAAKLTSGTVYALDVEPQMLEVLKQRIDEQHLKNIDLIEGAIENIPLDNDQVNQIIASFVLHEVELLSKGLQEIWRVLKSGGRCLCLEWEKKPMEQGPPLEHRIHSDDMKKAFEDSGFQIVHFTFPTESHYIIVAQK